MSTVAVSQLVPAAAAQLWRTFTDLPARDRHLSTVSGVEVLTPGGFAAGTRWRETRTLPDGATATEEFLVEAADPPLGCTLTSSGDGADYRITFRFTPVEVGRRRGGTVVTAVIEGGPTDAYGRLLALMFGGLAARTAEGALRREIRDLAAAACRAAAEPPVDRPVDRPGAAA
jgi:hypothetical protein